MNYRLPPLMFCLLFDPIVSPAMVLAIEKRNKSVACGDYQYIVHPDGTAEITAYTEDDEAVDIPRMLEGHLVTEIGEYAFGDDQVFSTPRLRSVTIPDSVKAIRDCAFTHCDSMVSLTIPYGVTVIGEDAFEGCSALNRLTLPDSIMSIGSGAFSFCSSLTSIRIPDSVETIGDNPFVSCDKLSVIEVAPDHPVLAVIDGVLISKTDGRLISYPCCKEQTSYTVPQGMKIIGKHAFEGNRKLKIVTIPNSVVTIEDAAFLLSPVIGITIPSSVKSIGVNSFFISGLSHDRLTLSVERGSYAEQYCKSNDIRYIYMDGLNELKN